MSDRVDTKKTIKSYTDSDIKKVLKYGGSKKGLNAFKVVREKVLSDISEYYEKHYFVNVDALVWVDSVLIAKFFESDMPIASYCNLDIIDYLDKAESASRIDYANTIIAFCDDVRTNVDEIIACIGDGYFIEAYERAIELLKYVYDEMLSVADFGAMYFEYA